MSISHGWILGRKGYDYLSDIHPKTSRQWRYQQDVANLFGIGGVYRDWMVGRSANERNAYTRHLYSLGDVSGKYPWLSSVNSTSPGVRAISTIAGLSAGGAGVFRRLYGSGGYHAERKKSWHEYGYQ